MRRARPLGSCWLSRHKALHVEGRVSLKHEVCRSSRFVSEDAERLSSFVLSAQLPGELLTRIVPPQKTNHSLGECPFEVGVADLGTAGSELATTGALGALDQTGVRSEFLHTRKTVNVVDLMKQGERNDRTDTWNGTQEVIGLGFIRLDGPDEISFDLLDRRVEMTNDLEIRLDHQTGAAVLEALGHTATIGLVGDSCPRGFEVVLVVGVQDVRQQSRPVAHQPGSPPEQVASRAHLRWVDIRLGVSGHFAAFFPRRPGCSRVLRS